jgi:hypothetical protein
MVATKYYGSKAEVYHGTAKYTKGGLTKADIKLVDDGYGNERYKSKKQMASGRKKGTFRDKWSKAMKSARAQLIKEDVIESGEFVPLGGKTKEGKALLKRTRELMCDTIEKMKGTRV